MKLPSVLKIAASALLIPAAGLAVLQSASQFSPAQADTLTRNTIAQTTPAQTPKRGSRGEKMYQQLNLSADQQAQIKSIREESKTSSQSLREQMKSAREQLQTLLANNNAGEDAIRQAHQQLQTLGQQMGDQRFDTMLKVRQVLTPEQRTKLAELHKQGGHHRQHRKGSATNGTDKAS